MVSITDALVLRLLDYGESDRIVTLLTLDAGKISAIAKGARRSRKRFGGGLSLFGWGQATLRERRGSELWILEEFHSGRGFPNLSQEIGRFGQASYACELCRELCPSGHPEPEVFYGLRSFLEQLDRLPLHVKPRIEPLLVFELTLLRFVGLQLSLGNCAVCGGYVNPLEKSADHQLPMDLERGGILCTSCLKSSSEQTQNIRWISTSVYETLRQLEQQTIGKHNTEDLCLEREALRICRDILLWLVQHHVGKKLHTVDFIYQMNQGDV